VIHYEEALYQVYAPLLLTSGLQSQIYTGNVLHLQHVAGRAPRLSRDSRLSTTRTLTREPFAVANLLVLRTRNIYTGLSTAKHTQR